MHTLWATKAEFPACVYHLVEGLVDPKNERMNDATETHTVSGFLCRGKGEEETPCW